MAVGCRGGSRLTGHADLNFWLEIERQMAVPSPGQPTRLPLMAVRRPTPGLHRLAGVAGAFFGCALRPGPAVLAWLLRPGPSHRPRVCVGHAREGGRPPRSRHRPSVLFRAICKAPLVLH